MQEICKMFQLGKVLTRRATYLRNWVKWIFFIPKPQKFDAMFAEFIVTLILHSSYNIIIM